MTLRSIIASLLLFTSLNCYADIDLTQSYDVFCRNIRENPTLTSYSDLLNQADQHGKEFIRDINPTGLDTKDHLIALVVAKRFSAIFTGKDWQTKNRVSLLLLSWLSTCAYELRDTPKFIIFDPIHPEILKRDLTEQHTRFLKNKDRLGTPNGAGAIEHTPDSRERFFAEHLERKPLPLDEPLTDLYGMNYPIFLALLFQDGNQLLANSASQTLQTMREKIEQRNDFDKEAIHSAKKAEEEHNKKMEIEAKEKADREAILAAEKAASDEREKALSAYRNREGAGGTVINLLSLFVILFSMGYVLKRPIELIRKNKG